MTTKLSQRNIAEFIEKLEGYLSEKIDHDAIRSYAWGLSESSPNEPEGSDKIFWSSVFSVIHLADADHWKDGCTQRDLSKLLSELKKRQCIKDS
jgi:hypothetical protein